MNTVREWAKNCACGQEIFQRRRYFDTSRRFRRRKLAAKAASCFASTPAKNSANAA
jgi:hypothetical protein